MAESARHIHQHGQPVKCRSCGGSGVDHLGVGHEYGVDPCSQCKGTGIQQA
jgi:DnaJ-class molecular chaperone